MGLVAALENGPVIAAVISALLGGGIVAIYRARSQNEESISNAAESAVVALRTALEEVRIEFTNARRKWEGERAFLQREIDQLREQVSLLNKRELELRRKIDKMQNPDT